MAHRGHCPDCGAALPAGVEAGQCSKCLANTTLGGGLEFPTKLADLEATTVGEAPVEQGEKSGRYVVLREFARGGMGRVLLVHDPRLNRDVALKEILPEDARTPGARTPTDKSHPAVARFLREARVTGQLEHPSITPVHDLGQDETGAYYYTMKLVRGRTLAEAMAACATLADRLKLLPHFVDLCQAVAYAHSRGVIHRDLKPHNVMLGEFGETVVLDWGLAKIKDTEDITIDDIAANVELVKAGTEADWIKTRAGQTLGTPFYMSPEQVRGDVEAVDERSDLFSLGAILYELLTGQKPFYGESTAEIFNKILSHTPPKVSTYNRNMPVALVKICARALAKDPDARFQSAKAFAEAVETAKLRFPKSRLRKTVERTALAAVVIIPLLITLANWMTEKHLEGVIARAEAKGIPLSKTDMKEYYVEITRDRGFLPAKEPANDDQRFTRIGAAYALDWLVPQLRERAVTAPWFYGNNVTVPLTTEAGEFVREETARNKSTFGFINILAGSPFGTMESVFDAAMQDRQRHPFALQIPNLLLGRACANLLTLDATRAVSEGSYAEAVGRCEDVMLLAESYDGIPTLIGCMIRLALIQIGLDCYEHTLQHVSAMPSADLERMKEYLLSTDVRDGYIRSLKGEAYCNLWLHQVVKGEHQYDGVALFPGSSFVPYFGRWLLRFWVNADQAYSLEVMTDFISATAAPKYASTDEVSFVLSRISDDVLWMHPVASMFMPSLYRSDLQVASTDARVALAAIATAYVQYRSDHGAAPPNMQVLAPDYLPAIPVDEFTGQPPLLTEIEGHPVLRSLGENRIADTRYDHYRIEPDELEAINAAIRLYEYRRGRYPTSLEELVPAFIEKLPTDTSGEVDLVYQTTKKGFTLDWRTDTHRRVPEDSRGDDIVWVLP